VEIVISTGGYSRIASENSISTGGFLKQTASGTTGGFLKQTASVTTGGFIKKTASGNCIFTGGFFYLAASGSFPAFFKIFNQY
jgi:hypothetical protein